jgi:hypothetical protein
LNNIFNTAEKPEIKKIIDKIAQTTGDEQKAQLNELRHECPRLVRFIESNRIFFDLASERLADKSGLKEKIEKNVASDSGPGDSEEDFFGYYEQGFYEPATPIQTNGPQARDQRNNFLQTALELADAVSEEIKDVTPVTEFTKEKAA